MASKKKPGGSKATAASDKAVQKKQPAPSLLVFGIGCSTGELTAPEKFFREAPVAGGIATLRGRQHL